MKEIDNFRILINASTCVVGGGVQVASSFISQWLKSDLGHPCKIAVSTAVKKDLRSLVDKKLLVEIHNSPASLFWGHESRKRLIFLEHHFQPSIIFTIFGPAYVNWRRPQLCGFADPWVTHRSKVAMNQLSLDEKLLKLLRCLYKKYNLRKNDFYWVETEVAKKGLMRVKHVAADRIKVIPNSYSKMFDRSKIYRKKDIYKNNIIKVLSLSAPYVHKNLSLIPKVLAEFGLRENGRKFRFIVTLPRGGKNVERFWKIAERLNVKDLIINVGSISINDCPDLYKECDIVFLPTVLETFSVTYLEAMKMERPIVTSNLDFARSVCGEAALYFDPACAVSAADALIRVCLNNDVYQNLVDAGLKRIKSFPTPEEKFRLHVDWIYDIYKKLIIQTSKLARN